VARVARQVYAAFRARSQASVAGGPAFATHAFRTRPRHPLATHTTSAAVRRVRRQIEAAVAAQSQRVFTQRNAASVDAALLDTGCTRTRTRGVASAAVVRVAPEFDTLVATDRLALRTREWQHRLVRLHRRDTQLGHDVTGVAIDAPALVVTSEPTQIPVDVARARADECDTER